MRNNGYCTADLRRSSGRSKVIDIEKHRKRLQRQRQVRRNIMILGLSALIVIIISVLFISFSSQARNIDEPVSYKYFKSIQIDKGDTLWSIAKENMDTEHYKNTSEYVEEIKTMNSLASDQIVAGRYIIVPYYSTEYVSASLLK